MAKILNIFNLDLLITKPIKQKLQNLFLFLLMD